MILDTDALIVVDVQNDFLSKGSLAVPDGQSVVPVINELFGMFQTSVLTADWHPRNHVSFVGSHHGVSVGDKVKAFYGEQIVWPSHCVAGTEGAAFAPDLKVHKASMILRKGTKAERDSYSAFIEADRVTKTGLEGFLRERNIRRIFIVGLALDFCVAQTAMDAAACGFDVVVVRDATRAVFPDQADQVCQSLEAVGVMVVDSLLDATY